MLKANKKQISECLLVDAPETRSKVKKKSSNILLQDIDGYLLSSWFFNTTCCITIDSISAL